MDFTGTGIVGAPPEAVFAVVADLATYPDWLGIVHGVVIEPEPEPGEAHAWLVDIGARIGPLTRTKRLRMIRTEHVAPSRVVFERAEQDGKTHSPWILAADLAKHDTGTALTMRLHYGGGLPLPGVDRLLAHEVSRAGRRIDRLVN